MPVWSRKQIEEDLLLLLGDRRLFGHLGLYAVLQLFGLHAFRVLYLALFSNHPVLVQQLELHARVLRYPDKTAYFSASTHFEQGFLDALVAQYAPLIPEHLAQIEAHSPLPLLKNQPCISNAS